MKKYVKEKEASLSPEVRNLLSVAYKNVVGARRSAWRALSSIEHHSESSTSSNSNVEVVKSYKKEVEVELNAICNDVIVSLYIIVLFTTKLIRFFNNYVLSEIA